MPSESPQDRAGETRGPRLGPAGDCLALAAAADHLRAPLADLLARAFRDNPLNRVVIRAAAESRLRSNRHGMQTLLSNTLGRATVLAAHPARSDGTPLGCLVALEPFGYPLPAPPLMQQLRVVLGQGVGVSRRWGQVFAALQAVHPLEPHWYLAVLGVEPEQQARGIGSALLARWLETVDAEEAPAYLETDRAENVAFYARAGFRTLDSQALLGVTIWRMWREPASAGVGGTTGMGG